MGWLGPSSKDVLIARLQSELSDTRHQLLEERKLFNEERRELLDQILALANPLALREVRRPPLGERVAPASGPDRSTRRFPQGERIVTPPYPSPLQPPHSPSNSGEES